MTAAQPTQAETPLTMTEKLPLQLVSPATLTLRTRGYAYRARTMAAIAWLAVSLCDQVNVA
ncbi:hypothetical protein NYG90_06595 [Helicobacter sp. XJK30-2]|uniref:Uncharacterized protein n=1 Tax=Helicobacter zhangjianzhongii TaxID=2974574 RepID=A0ACC6FTC0_9HELI|nr:hypothetical protein [Helicobacter sp. XJK30-2]